MDEARTACVAWYKAGTASQHRHGHDITFNRLLSLLPLASLSVFFVSLAHTHATMASPKRCVMIAVAMVAAMAVVASSELAPVPLMFSPGDGEGAVALVSSSEASYVCLKDGRVQRVDQAGNRFTTLDIGADVRPCRVEQQTTDGQRKERPQCGTQSLLAFCFFSKPMSCASSKPPLNQIL